MFLHLVFLISEWPKKLVQNNLPFPGTASLLLRKYKQRHNQFTHPSALAYRRGLICCTQKEAPTLATGSGG
jgi:hypothetical protein